MQKHTPTVFRVLLYEAIHVLVRKGHLLLQDLKRDVGTNGYESAARLASDGRDIFDEIYRICQVKDRFRHPDLTDHENSICESFVDLNISFQSEVVLPLKQFANKGKRRVRWLVESPVFMTRWFCAKCKRFVVGFLRPRGAEPVSQQSPIKLVEGCSNEIEAMSRIIDSARPLLKDVKELLDKAT